MAEEVIEVTVFVSCPDELKLERDLVKAVCEDITIGLGANTNIRLKTIDFRQGVVPIISGDGAQSEINKQIGDYDYDIHIGIFWKYFGVKQDNGLTPTEEEFEIAFGRFRNTGRPIIQFYFKSEPFYPKGTFDADQALRVQEFKENRIKPLGIYEGFQDKDEFRSKMTRHLLRLVQNTDWSRRNTPNIPKIPYDKVPLYLARNVYLTKDYSSANKFRTRDEFAVDLLSIVKQEKRIVLLGDAGVGKTTELSRIASHYSKEEENLFPIFISLNKYVHSLTELLPSYWTEIPENQLLLLLDGLDEIESKNRNDAIRQIELFTERYPTSHVLVSSRTNFYSSETQQSIGTLNNFSSYTLLNLERKAIEEYVRKRLEE